MKNQSVSRLIATATFAFISTGSLPADTITVPIAPAADTRIFNADWGRDLNDGSGTDIGVYQARDRSLLRFDLSSLPTGSTLDSVNLVMTVSGTFGGNPNAETMNVYRLTQPWTESGVTWNRYDGASTWATGGGDFDGTVRASANSNPGVGQTVTWDVTTLAQDWAANTFPNHGLIVINSGNTNGIHFASKENGTTSYRPYLSATITTPATAPAGAWSWNGGDGVSGPVDGAGDWTGSNKWWNGAAASWADGNDTIIGAGGTAGIITISGTVSPKSIWFQPVASGNYTLTGGTIDLGGATRILAATADATIASDLVNGTILKQGAGKITFNGANTYAGGTIIGNGTIEIGNGGTLGTGSVSNNAALVFNHSEDQTVSNAILGTGSLTKNGTGLLELTAINSYTGGTTVNDGLLILAGNGGNGRIRGALTINADGTVETTGDGTGLGYTDQISSVAINGGVLTATTGMHLWNITGGITMTGGLLQSNNGVSDPNGAFLEWNRTNVTTLASADSATIGGRIRIRGDNGFTGITFTVADGAATEDLVVSAAITQNTTGMRITKDGPGTMSITGATTYTGPTTVNAGILSLGDGANQTNLNDSATVALTAGAKLLLDFTGTDIVGAITLDSIDQGTGFFDATTHPTLFAAGGSGKLFVPGGPIDDNNGTWSSATDDYWEFPTSWSGGTVASGTDGTAIFNGATGTTVTLAGNITIGNLSFSVADYTITGADKTLDLDSLGVSTIFVDAARTATISSKLTSFGEVAKTGGGTLKLFAGNGDNYSNTYNHDLNGLDIQGGTVELTSQFIRLGAINIGPGATLASSVPWATGSSNPWFDGRSAGPITVQNGGTLTVTNSGAVGNSLLQGLTLLGGSVTAPGLSNGDWGAFVLASTLTVDGNATSTISADFALAGTRTVDVTSGSTLLFSGDLHNRYAAVGGITKEGDGPLVFTGAKTYSGPTTINAGTLQLGDGTTNGSLPASTIANNASLVVNPGTNQTFSQTVTGSGSFTKSGATTLTITAPQTYTGDTIVNGGTLELQNNSASVVSATIPNAGFESPDYANGVWNWGGNNWTFNGGAGTTSSNTTWMLVAPEGDQGGFLQLASSIGNSVTVPADGNYVLTFYTANRPGYAASGLNISINGNTVGTYTSGQLGSGGAFLKWTTAPVALTAGTYPLLFQGIPEGADSGTIIDAVTLTNAVVTNGRLTFKPQGNGISNQVTGTGSAVLNGQFYLDLSLADTTNGNTWTLVNHATLTESYGSDFSVTSNLGTFTNSAGTWTLVDGANTWTFKQSDGTLSLAVPPSDPFASWMASNFPGIAFPDNQPGADPDKDGIDNLLEYVLQDGNPSLPNPGILPVLDASGSDFIFTFHRRAAATGTVQTFQYGGNLVDDWADLPVVHGGQVSITPDTPNAGIDEVLITIPKNGATEMFGRLKVTK